MTKASESFNQWALVELFGHSRIAGLVKEQSIGGCSFLRVDVPAHDPACAGGCKYGRDHVNLNVGNPGGPLRDDDSLRDFVAEGGSIRMVGAREAVLEADAAYDRLGRLLAKGQV